MRIKGVKVLLIIAVLTLAVFANAETRTDARGLWSGAITSGGMCSAGIALSNNPSKAATIGIPVGLVGNLVAWKIGKRHPKAARLLQLGSGTACFGTGLALSAKAQSMFPAPVPASSYAPPVIGSGTSSGNGGNTGGNGTGGAGAVAGGSGTSAGSGSVTPSSGGNGNGATGSGGSSSGGSGGNGTASRCLQDCGLGNDGMNRGNDTNKPPFPGIGPKH